MAKRELSTTLRNLKFMQRAALREEKPKEEEEVKPTPADSSFGASTAPTRRCIVIMEGDPHPGAFKGRMSFQSFNPSIDKLNEAAANVGQMKEHSSSINHQDSYTSERVNGTSAMRFESSNVASETSPDVDLKRKQPETMTGTQSSKKSQKEASWNGQSSSQNNWRGSTKQQKREKLDWNLLRPKAPNKMG